VTFLYKSNVLYVNLPRVLGAIPYEGQPTVEAVEIESSKVAALSEEHNRLIDVLNYIEHVLPSENAVTLVEAHKDFLALGADISKLPGVRLEPERDDNEIVWLELKRLVEKVVPSPSDDFLPWVVLQDDPTISPYLRSSIAVQVRWADSKSFDPEDPRSPDEMVEEEIFLDERPRVREEFDRWLTNVWQPWSMEETPRRASIKLYGQLYKLHSRVTMEEARSPLEIVWGACFTVGTVKGKKVRYPLISTPVYLRVEEKTKSLLVQPREVAEQKPSLEYRLYEPLGISGLTTLIATHKKWAEDTESEFSPFKPDSYRDVARSAAANLSSKGIYWGDEKGDVPGESAENLIITDEWCLFARSKTRHFMIEDVRRLREKVKLGEKLAEGPRELVADPLDERPVDIRRNYRGIWGMIQSAFGESTSASEDPTELYFPKPYNSEQLNIIDRLSHGNGVVVQGPPGTGKTHTIANVICHYLALGKRVLVTSKGSTALSVLRAKLPTDIQPLVVTRLGNDAESNRQLEESVRAIGESISGESAEGLKRLIEKEDGRISTLHTTLQRIEGKMREWARRHWVAVPSDPEGRKPIEIAEIVANATEVLGRFPDRLGVESEFDPSFTADDIVELRMARNQLGAEIEYLGEVNPLPDRLPTPAEVRDIAQQRAKLLELARRTKETKSEEFRSHEPDLIRKAEKLLETVNAFIQGLKYFHARAPWEQSILFTIRSAEQTVVATELLRLRDEADRLEKIRLERLTRRIEIPVDLEQNEDALEMITREAAGKNRAGLVRRLVSGTTRGALAQLELVRIDGRPVAQAAEWKAVLAELELFKKIRAEILIWNNLSHELTAPSISGVRWEGLRELRQRCTVVSSAAPLNPDTEALIRQLRSEVFHPNATTADSRTDLPSLEKVRESLELNLPGQRSRALSDTVKEFRGRFAGCSGRVTGEALSILSALEDSSAVDADAIGSKWAAVLKEVHRLADIEPARVTVQRVLKMIEECGGRNLAAALRCPTDEAVSANLLPHNFHEIWQHRRWLTYLEEIDCQRVFSDLVREKNKAEGQLTRAYEEVIRLRTWLQLKLRLTAKVRGALNTYLLAVQSLGKGKGVRAPRHRRVMQGAMNDAFDAIPCWIMPQWHVAESMPAEIGLFDLVIVDEASQSGVDAFPAVLRGKKILVVGDDEQISPTTFEREEEVNRIAEKYLGRLNRNYSAQLAPGKSFYDFAKVVFPNAQVILKEHFRCVEPIITFSNQLSYNGRIECLRIPKPSERLEPPLIDVFVHGASRADKINEFEAQAIVREICAIASNPSLENRSIGVISLIGSEQANRIYTLIEERLGRDVIERHAIVCGDSSTFQGNERDIMFLSMIVTPETARADTGRTSQQRLNVAASRARDRMYLYRSVRREDLRDGDLKARLLDHFAEPLPRQGEEEKEGRELCESPFEEAVYDELVSRGYRVRPQVRASGYFIDMVVEGENDNRLAIECDGDRYHPPEKWDEDLQRQRVLERAGWRFWRCFGSDFYRNRAECIADLLSELSERKIFPVKAESAGGVGNKYTEYREVDPGDPDFWSGVIHRRQGTPSGQKIEPIVSAPSYAKGSAEEGPVSDAASPPTRTKGKVDLDEVVEYRIVPEAATGEGASEVRTLRVVELGGDDIEAGIVNAKGAVGRVLLGSVVGTKFEIEIVGASRICEIVSIQDIDDLKEESPLGDARGEPPFAAVINQSCDIAVNPYVSWVAHPLIDPREARPAQVLEGLLEIVRVESPIVCKRAFALYMKAAGCERLGADIKDSLVRGLQAGVTKGLVRSENEFGVKNRLQNVLRIPGQSENLPRAAGGRALDDIPPSEVAHILRGVMGAFGGGGNKDKIYREVLRLLGGGRLTNSSRACLEAAEKFLVPTGG
jgi:very-short-patch-repair endonuclease